MTAVEMTPVQASTTDLPSQQRRRSRHLRSLLLGLALPVGLGAMWELAAAIVAFAVIGKTTAWLIAVASAPLLRWQDAYGQNAGEA